MAKSGNQESLDFFLIPLSPPASPAFPTPGKWVQCLTHFLFLHKYKRLVFHFSIKIFFDQIQHKKKRDNVFWMQVHQAEVSDGILLTHLPLAM